MFPLKNLARKGLNIHAIHNGEQLMRALKGLLPVPHCYICYPDSQGPVSI